jgi:hypothetical protein
MRALPAFLVAVGCTSSDPGWTTDPGPTPGGGSTLQCSADSDCGSTMVCARTQECLPPSSVYTVHVTWTLQSMPASAATCASSPDLAIFFFAPGSGGNWGYEPVPCVEGKFTVDKLPTWFSQVELGNQNTNDGFSATIDRTSGTAAIDLPY